MTFNANGIRSAARKGFFEWFLKQNVDVLCIQEIKAYDEQLQDEVFKLVGYTRYILSAEKAGYSGVAIYTRLDVDEVIQPLEGVWLKEGRLIGVKVLGIEVYSLYLPSGTQGDVRQAIKYTLMDELHQWMSTKLSTPTIIVGDWNIAHQNIDLKNWKSNQKNSGFLPQEREWLTQLFSNGWFDAFRLVNDEPDHYTWWTYRANARANNVGWRIDYHIINAAVKMGLKDTRIDPAPIFSDHAPLTMTYDIDRIGIQ